MTGEFSTLHFDEQGNHLYAGEQEAVIHSLLNTDKPVTDLWLFSHGWNTNEEQADTTYYKWVRLMQERIQQEITDSKYRPLFVGIYWPSMAWVDNVGKESAPLLPSPFEGTSFPIDSGEFEMDTDEIEWSGGPGELDDEREYAQREIGTPGTVDRSPAEDLTDQTRFIEAYRPLMDPRGQNAADYERDFALLYDILTTSYSSSFQLEAFMRTLYRYKIDDPHTETYEDMNILNSPESALAYLQAQLRSSTTYESFQPSDILFQFFQTFSFWTMKARAAIVGRHGVMDFLRDVKDALLLHNRQVLVHLLGHSFGAKLVSAAVYSLADVPNLQPPMIDSLILLLGAFSQFSFSSRIPLTLASGGRYAPIIEHHLVANPVTAIYSRHDLANRRCYPFGMLMARPGSTYELGGPDDLLGSIGANGVQGLETTSYHVMNLLPLEVPYNRKHFANISCLNIDGQHIINAYTDKIFVGAHGDIYHPEIFHLALAVSRHA